MAVTVAAPGSTEAGFTWMTSKMKAIQDEGWMLLYKMLKLIWGERQTQKILSSHFHGQEVTEESFHLEV